MLRFPLCLAGALAVSLGASGAEASAQDATAVQKVHTRIVAETTLQVLDTVVVPRFSEETAWFERPRSLEPSSVDGHLWAVDPSAATLTEIDTAGTVVRVLGRKGQGPGELQNPAKLIDTGKRILVLDRAGKILILSQAGSFDSEIRLESRGWDVAAHGDREFVVVAGENGLVDVYKDGQRTRSVGVSVHSEMACRSCKVAMLPDGRIVVAEPSVPQLRLFSASGTTSTVIDLRNELMTQWQGSRTSRRRDSRGSSKDWISEVVAVDTASALLLMSPPSPASGTELWKVDLQTGTVGRSQLSGKFVTSGVLTADGFFALLGEFRATSPSSNEVLREGSPAIVRFAEP